MKAESKFILAFFAGCRNASKKGPIMAPMSIQNFRGGPHERTEHKTQGWQQFILNWVDPKKE